MKNLLIAITVLVSNFTYSQYLPLLNEGNSWSVDVYYDVYDTGESGIISSQITLGDIEYLDGLRYYRVWSEDNPTCLLREENGIVYKYDEQEEVDKILFDFTLEEGDTFNLYGSAYDSRMCTGFGTSLHGVELTVDTIEEIEIAGELRIVITFLEYTSFGNIQWIEGIGNITGFDMLWGPPDTYGPYALVCFTTNGITYFFNGADSCDNTTLGIDEFSNNNLILYPNPVTNKSILQLPSEGYADTIRIFDLQGRLVKEMSIFTDYFIIDAMQYQSGLYFYQVFSAKELLKTDKFIVK